jgi:D-sedoheptulose 7-phosphate isomerase
VFDQQAYLNAYVEVVRSLDTSLVERIALTIFDAWEAGRTVFCCGNGGSASSAGHFVADLTKLTAPAIGRRLRALALTDSISAVSAIANDISYHEVFVEQLRAFLDPRDVVIGFSTSGQSRNVLRAIEYANAVGATTIGVTGNCGQMLGGLAQQTVYVDATSVQQIEDATMVVAHLLCLHVKELIAEAGPDLKVGSNAVSLDVLPTATSSLS